MKLNIQTLNIALFAFIPCILYSQGTTNYQQSVNGGTVYGYKIMSDNLLTLEEREAAKYVQKAKSYRTSKIYDSSFFYFRKALNLTPKDGATYYRRASLEQELYQYRAALADFDSAVKYKQDQSNLYFNRAFMHLKLKNYQAAIDDYTVEINKWSRYTNAYINRAIAKRKLGRYKETLDDYDTILKIWPTNTLALNNKAWVHLFLGDTVEGMAGLKKTLLINPLYKNALDTRVYAIYNLADYEDCIVETNDVLAKLKQLECDYYIRGKASNKLHHYEESIADYNKALDEHQINPARLDGSHEQIPVYANTAKAESEIALGMLDSAILHCTIAINLDSSYKQAFNTRGLAYYLQGKYKKALKDYDAAIGAKEEDSSMYQPIYQYRDEAKNASKSPLIYVEWLSPRDDINNTYKGTLFVAGQKEMKLKLRISSASILTQDKIFLYQNGQIVDANKVQISMKPLHSFKLNYEYEINTLVTLPPYVCTFKVGYENNYSQILTISPDLLPTYNSSDKAFYSWTGFPE